MSLNMKVECTRLVQSWKPHARVRHVGELTPDASMRRYYRVLYEEGDKPFESVVVMFFDSVAAAEVGEGAQVASDEAYLELTKFFLVNGVRVPEVYLDAREEQMLLLEDLGDRSLGALLLDKSENRFTDRMLDRLYLAAVEQLVILQKLPQESGFFAFERRFSKELYEKEMQEFLDYILEPLEVPSAEQALVKDGCSALAASLVSHPVVLSHRDFHSWNLMFDEAEHGVCLIDFQDALMAPRAYDLASLLNDRDSDFALGKRRSNLLLESFVELMEFDSDFYIEFAEVLLQRDLKVAGRFAKLSQTRGLKQYEQWIPGTVERISRTLESLTQRQSELGKSLQAMREVLQVHIFSRLGGA